MGKLEGSLVPGECLSVNCVTDTFPASEILQRISIIRIGIFRKIESENYGQLDTHFPLYPYTCYIITSRNYQICFREYKVISKMDTEPGETKEEVCCDFSWLQKCISKMVGKTKPREENTSEENIPLHEYQDRLSLAFGDNSIFLSESALESQGGDDEEDDDEFDGGEEEILVAPMSRQISPLPSLHCSGPLSASRSLVHLCLQCSNSSASLVTCGACNLAEYCSVDCQALHRPQHRDTCGKLQRLLRRLYQVLTS